MNPILLVVALLTAGQATYSQAQNPKTKKFDSWAWTKESWTADERPYRRIRLYIDKFIAQGQDPAVLAKQYRKTADNPTDGIGQYRWSYAAYEAARRTSFTKWPGGSIDDIEKALSGAASWKPVPTYEYARLRFLADARQSPDSKLAILGKRLLKRDPKDHEVRFYYIATLSPRGDKKKAQELLRENNILIKALPNKPTVYSLLGESYMKVWIGSKNPVDADKSIAAYRKFLQVAPANHPFRKGAEGQIRFIQQMKPRWKKS